MKEKSESDTRKNEIDRWSEKTLEYLFNHKIFFPGFVSITKVLKFFFSKVYNFILVSEEIFDSCTIHPTVSGFFDGSYFCCFKCNFKEYFKSDCRYWMGDGFQSHSWSNFNRQVVMMFNTVNVICKKFSIFYMFTCCRCYMLYMLHVVHVKGCTCYMLYIEHVGYITSCCFFVNSC